MRRRKEVSREEISVPVVNLTPLIDVVFVVLITFILVAPLLQINPVELASGNAKTVEPLTPLEENQSIQIVVKRDNSLYLQSQPVSNFSQLKRQLRELRKQFPSSSLLVIHDRQAFFETYQNIKNLAEEMEFDEMKIVLSPA